jgi:uncharacterized protein
MHDRYGLHFVLKVASRCNLNCSYCYVYNKGDNTWMARPPIMPDHIFEAALERIREHCISAGQKYVTITFHGGEPCLAGSDRFSAWCRRIDEVLGNVATVRLSLQTNATLLDERWAGIIAEHNIDVGISVDGTPDVHDTFRVDHAGRGSYAAVERGLDVLRQSSIPLRFLCVIQPGASGLEVHRHLAGLGAASIDYLLPDFTHDLIGSVREKYGPTPCADYLIPIFDEWWRNQTLGLKIKIFWNMSWLILGGESTVDMFGNKPLSFLFVETDGAIEALDVLRVCKEGIAGTGLNVLHSRFMDVRDLSELHKAIVFDGVPLPSTCRACPEKGTCGGGYLPHRYSAERAFDNPTVWCADLLRLFSHIREHLDTSVEETSLRRAYLADLTLKAVGSR